MCLQTCTSANAGAAAVQVILNVWCVAEFVREVSGYGEAKNMTFWGNRYDPSAAGLKVGFIIWVHYNNKFVELLDTLWMILRKKDRQVRLLPAAMLATLCSDAFPAEVWGMAQPSTGTILCIPPCALWQRST